MSAVKVGQVWRDKDKRRNTVIEIISSTIDSYGNHEVIGLVVGTEEERTYSHDRLVKRWELIEEKGGPDEVERDLKPAPEIDLDEFVNMNDGPKAAVKAAAPKNWQLKAVCQQNDDYKVRFTKRIAEVYGMPLCPCHQKPLVFAEGR